MEYAFSSLVLRRWKYSKKFGEELIATLLWHDTDRTENEN
jgi:hypothetical protein